MSLRGRIVDVDARRHTVKVVTDQAGRTYENVQISSPYYHFAGDGDGHLPRIDAKCMIHIASDDTPPFVMGYLDVPNTPTDAEVESQAGNEETQPSADEGVVSFTAAKPQAFPGDMWRIGQDGNFSFMRAGGVLQHGASAFCQRIYIPIQNLIRDLAENYQLSTIGGDLIFESDREEDSDDAAEGFRVKLLVNKELQDKNSSLMMVAGKVGGDVLLRVALKSNGIDRAQATVDSPSVELVFHEDGKVDVQSSDWTQTVNGMLTQTVTGSMKTKVTGSFDVNAANSSETITGVKRIAASTIQLGGQISFGGGGGAVCGNAKTLEAWLKGHTHTHSGVPGSPTSPPAVPPPDVALPNVSG